MTAKWTLEELDGIAPRDVVTLLTELETRNDRQAATMGQYEQRIAALTAERDQARAERAAWEPVRQSYYDLERQYLALQAENAALRAALAAAQVWTPLPDAYYGEGGNKSGVWVELGGEYLSVEGPVGTSSPSMYGVHLPGHRRFCERRAPAQEDAP